MTRLRLLGSGGEGAGSVTFNADSTWWSHLDLLV